MIYDINHYNNKTQHATYTLVVSDKCVRPRYENGNRGCCDTPCKVSQLLSWSTKSVLLPLFHKLCFFNRIFTEFGNIPGLDLAYTHKGEVYHTHFDTPELIQPGSIQCTGKTTEYFKNIQK